MKQTFILNDIKKEDIMEGLCVERDGREWRVFHDDGVPLSPKFDCAGSLAEWMAENVSEQSGRLLSREEWLDFIVADDQQDA